MGGKHDLAKRSKWSDTVAAQEVFLQLFLTLCLVPLDFRRGKVPSEDLFSHSTACHELPQQKPSTHTAHTALEKDFPLCI